MAVFKDEKGRWGFSVRYKDAFGNTKQKKSVNKDWTKKKAKEEEKKFIAKATNTAITLENLRQIYMQSKKLKIKESTYVNKEINYYNYIEPYFGEMDISKINETMIEHWQQQLLARGLSLSTIKIIQGELKAMLLFAFKRRFINNLIVIENIVNDKPIEEKKKFITKEELDLISEELKKRKNRNLHNAIHVLYYTGLRIGELLALTNNDVVGNSLLIRKSYNRKLNKISSTKSNKSRTVTVSDRILGLIKEQEEYYRASGIKGDLYLFGGYQPMDPSYIRKQYQLTCNQLGIEKTTIHALRHTHVSNLIALGFNVFQISERTGHSVEMINNIYGHVISNPQIDMANKLEKL